MHPRQLSLDVAEAGGIVACSSRGSARAGRAGERHCQAAAMQATWAWAARAPTHRFDRQLQTGDVAIDRCDTRPQSGGDKQGPQEAERNTADAHTHASMAATASPGRQPLPADTPRHNAAHSSGRLCYCAGTQPFVWMHSSNQCLGVPRRHRQNTPRHTQSEREAQGVQSGTAQVAPDIHHSRLALER
jgi:hypothetical protein